MKTEKENKRWKSRLLSSSLPLEFDVSKMLYKIGSSVTYDYSFNRIDENNLSKEFSIDLLAICLLQKENEILGSIDFLVECKYREQNKKWIFLPEINEDTYTNVSMGLTTRYFPEFDTKNLSKDVLYEIDELFEYGFKGFEINTNTGEVTDKDIRHGLNQLRYSLPYKIKENIESAIYGHIEDIIPFFVYPILVTNAELMLLDKEFGIEKVRAIENLNELGKTVPYIIVENKVGPDFQNHHKRIFDSFKNLELEKNNLFKLEKIRENYSYNFLDTPIYDSPRRKHKELFLSYSGTMNEYYSRFIICNIENLESLLEKITLRINDILK